MLNEVSDTEDSFSGDEDDIAGGEEGEAKEPSVPLPLTPLAPTITPGTDASASSEGEGGGTKKPEATNEEEDKGDPEMAAVYLKKLLPVFAELFHSSQAPPLR